MAKIGTVSGATITFGAEAEFLSASSPGQISVTGLSATQFVVAYTDYADSQHGTAKVGTVSGTAITFGAEAEFMADVAGGYDISVASLSATRFIVVYTDYTTGMAKVGTISGTSITFSAKEEFLSTGAANDNSVAILSSTQFVVAYRDASVGAARVGVLLSGASITASTPAMYGTAAAATKVAFCGWFQNPSG